MLVLSGGNSEFKLHKGFLNELAKFDRLHNPLSHIWLTASCAIKELLLERATG